MFLFRLICGRAKPTPNRIPKTSLQWRELRLEARELGMPIEALAEVIIADFIRRNRPKQRQVEG
jgi:hypothetical protein